MFKDPKIVLIGFLVLMLAIYALVNFSVKKIFPEAGDDQEITSFADCAEAGYPVMESYPEQCRTPDGRTFTRDITGRFGWATTTDQISQISFSYPPSLSFNYITAVDWPPAVRLDNDFSGCLEAGQTTARAGQTGQRVIDGKNYCVTVVSEGAAGSVYNQYAYSLGAGDEQIIMTFSLKFVQCLNYDEPKQSDCLAEQGNFSPDSMVGLMFESIVD